MSHLASIASMLSPSKPAQKEEQPQQNNGDRTEAQSRPASPQVRIQSKVPVPQTSATASPARPRSPVPGTAAGAKIGANPNSRPASPESRPTSPSRISSRIAALTGAARSNTVASASTATSRENSPKIGSQAASPSRFGITRSPRLKQALRMDSPASPSASHQQAPTSVATASGLPTPTKMKRPMLSPIQSPNSQRSLALSSLRKAVPGFETNSFSPPASPRLPSTTSISSNLHHIAPTHASTVNDAVKATQIQKQLEEVEKEVQMQLEKDEDLINQHARAISALGKSLPPPSSLPRSKQESADSGKKAKPAGLSPPAKSPLRKMNSKTALANTTSLAQEMRKGDEEVRAQTTLPTPSRDANETIVPQTVVKKTDTDAPVQNTAHKDSVVDVPPASPIFSSFLANNKRTSTLSFAGLPGRALGATGREKSIGLGLGLGKSLGASSMKDKIPAANQLEDADSQSSTQGHTRQSFYTAALASQSRKRLSSTLGSNVGLNGLGSYGDNGDPGGSKAPRSEFSNTARASILASQVQRDQPAPTMSHSARFDLLRSRISNIKGSTGYMPPSTSMRTSFATSSQAPFSVHHLQSSAPNGKPEAIAQVDTTQTTDNDKPQILFSPTVSQSIPTSTTVKDIAPLPTSTTSTFASTIASFVPAQSFGASFASIFGAGAMKATKPESPAKTKANELEANNGGTSKQVQSTLYPSLPSMNNLNMPLASFTSPEKMVRKPRLEPEDEELVEELASSADHQEAGVLPAPSSAVSSPAHEKKRSSSVLSIVSNIEAKEAEARREKERQASLSPRKASGSIPIPVIQNAPARASAPRSTTPTFSPPKQDTLARLSTGHSEARTSSRPESRLSDMPALPGPEGVSPDLSIAGLVDIEDPGLDAIPRTFSDDAEIPTTEAASVAEDEEMEEADDEGDEPEFGGARRKSGDISVKPAVLLQQSAPAPKIIKPAAPHAGNLSKSTFKPSRPAKEGFEPQVSEH